MNMKNLKRKKDQKNQLEKKKKRALYKFVTSNNQYIIENLAENLIMINKIKY